MANTVNLFIDLNEAELDLEPEELEAYSRRLAADLEDGLVEEAGLARAAEVPEGAKSGNAGFDLGILKAEVNLKNILAVLTWLRNRIAGATLSLEYGDVRLEYRTPEQLEQQLQALETISHLTVRVVKSETRKD
ncbi:hypothetical protein [Sphaerothrix gracilis]|uniref:hypothetical protein n=1 Tax=Sphaerothrix gracilis TaxID=3151835 RepID=UPI0031FCB3C2